MILPYVPLCKNRKSEIEKIVSDSNKILEKYHSSIAKKQGSLGFITTDNKKMTKINLLSLLLNYEKNKDFEYNGIKIPAEDIKKIILSKSLEYDILCNFSAMLAKIISNCKKNTTDVCLDKEDLESEAIKLAISAIYTYDNSTSLSTYIFLIVSRGIRAICKKTTPFSELGRGALKIKHQYESVKNQLGPNATFDSIVEKAKFTTKQIKIIQSLFVSASGQSVFSDPKNNSLMDYTFLGKKFSGLDGRVSYSCSSNGFGFTIKNNIEKDSDIILNLEADLSDLEKTVLKGFLESSTKSLGINSLTKDFINPKTNKPYSRMAVTYAWRRVKEKLSKNLKVA